MALSFNEHGAEWLWKILSRYFDAYTTKKNSVKNS